jgi:hypothetical protein
MPNVANMEAAFNDLVEKYESSQRRLINTYAGNMGRNLNHEKAVLKQDVAALKKRFDDAKNEA